jgi:hypothetical protein
MLPSMGPDSCERDLDRLLDDALHAIEGSPSYGPPPVTSTKMLGRTRLPSRCQGAPRMRSRHRSRERC